MVDGEMCTVVATVSSGHLTSSRYLVILAPNEQRGVRIRLITVRCGTSNCDATPTGQGASQDYMNALVLLCTDERLMQLIKTVNPDMWDAHVSPVQIGKKRTRRPPHPTAVEGFETQTEHPQTEEEIGVAQAAYMANDSPALWRQYVRMEKREKSTEAKLDKVSFALAALQKTLHDTVRGHDKLVAEDRATTARETAAKGKLQKKVEKLQAAAEAATAAVVAAVKECGTCDSLRKKLARAKQDNKALQQSDDDQPFVTPNKLKKQKALIWYSSILMTADFTRNIFMKRTSMDNLF